MTNDLKQRVTDAMVEAAFYANHDERIPPSKIERETVRRSIEAALSVSSSGEAVAVHDDYMEAKKMAEWICCAPPPIKLVRRLAAWRASARAAHPSPLSVQTGVAVSKDAIRAELKRREKIGELVVHQTYDDAGLSVEEYVELIDSILSALSSAPAPSVEEIRGALEPFSDAATYYNDKAGNDIRVPIALRHLRRARELFGRLAPNSDAAGEGK